MVFFFRLVSTAYLIFFVCFVLFQKRFKTTKTQIRVIYILFALSLAVIAYYMTPPSGWDIVRHFANMNKIRHLKISLFDFLFASNSYIGGYGYSGLFMFNALQYIVVKISDNNFLISAICAFICYSIVGYITIDWQEMNGKISSVNALSLLLCFSFMPFIYVVSGLRNALAASILGLAIYLYLYKKKRFYVFIILCFIAATIHPASLITIPFVIIARFNIGIVGYICVFIVSAIAQTVAKWMSTSSILYFRIVGQKYFSFTSDDQYRASRAPLYTVLLLIVIFLFVYFASHFRKRSNNEDDSRKLIYSFFAVYMVYILGNIGNYDMVLRPAYVLGPLSPVLCSLIVDDTQWAYNRLDVKAKSMIRLIALSCCYILVIYLQYKLAVGNLQYFI